MTLDLVTTQPLLPRSVKASLRRLSFSECVVMQMFAAFVNAKLQGSETIVWMAGLVHEGIGYVFKLAFPDLRYASPVCAETDHSWLLEWLRSILETCPFLNLIVQAHIHPLGSGLSIKDTETLLNLSDWSDRIYFASLVLDLDMGCYCVNDERITRLEWGVEEKWSESKPSEPMECSTTSRLSLVRRVFGRLREQL